MFLPEKRETERALHFIYSAYTPSLNHQKRWFQTKGANRIRPHTNPKKRCVDLTSLPAADYSTQKESNHKRALSSFKGPVLKNGENYQVSPPTWSFPPSTNIRKYWVSSFTCLIQALTQDLCFLRARINTMTRFHFRKACAWFWTHHSNRILSYS